MRVNAGGAGDHLLQPGTGADAGQRRDHGGFGRVQPLIGHRRGDQDGGLCRQAEGGQRGLGIGFLAGGDADILTGLVAADPAAQARQIAPSTRLIRRHDQQLA